MTEMEDSVPLYRIVKRMSSTTSLPFGVAPALLAGLAVVVALIAARTTVRPDVS